MGNIHIKKWTALLSALALTVSVLSACTQEPPPDTQPPVAEQTEPDQTEPKQTESLPVGSTARQTVAAFAEENGLPFEAYPTYLIDLLDKNPETEDFVLNFPLEYGKLQQVDMSEYADSEQVPLFMQWDRRWGYMRYGSGVAGMTACGPISLSMVAWHLTNGDPNTSPDRLIRFAIEEGYCVAGDGTSWSLISQGAKKLGLSVRELQLSERQVLEQLEAGNPVICIMGPGDFTTSGHYIVMVGQENGLIRVNDCNSANNSQKLWAFSDIQDQIRNLWALSR